jgi:PAS domain S-box-containing protein
MVQTVRSPILRYGIAVLIMAIAIGIKLLIEPFVEVETPFLLLFAAVMVAALVGGRLSGLVATVLAAVASNYFFFSKKFAFNFHLGAMLQLGLFILEGILVIQVIVALTSARRQFQLSQEALHNAYADLEQRVHDRTVQLSAANQQLQQQIAEREQMENVLQSFFDSASMMMGIVELAGEDVLHIIDNAAVGRFLGVDPEHLKQRLASELGTPRDTIQIWVDHYREAERSQIPVRFEYPHINANGQQFWLSATVCQIPGYQTDRPRFAYIVEDISDRKQTQLQLETTQQALQAANNLLRGIIDGSNDLITAIDREFRYSAFNRSFQQEFQQLFGRPAEVGMTLMESLAHIPEEQAKAIALWSRALQGEEFTVIQKFGHDQTHQTYEITFSSIRNAQGELIGASQIVRNVTERIRIEEEIRRLNAELEERVQQRTAQLEAMNQLLEQEVCDRRAAEWELARSEQQFRATFNQAAVGIAHVGLDGRWLRLNQKLCEIVGYPQEELLQKTFQDITYAPDLEADLAQAARLLAGEIQTYSMEKRYIRKDGSLVWINLTGSLVRESATEPDHLGEPLYFIAMIQDISDRKQAEEALRQSEERFRVALQYSPITVFNQDRDLRYTWIYNPKLGYTLKDILGATDYDLNDPQTAAILTEIKQQTLTSGVGRRQEVQVNTPTGEESGYYDLTVEPMRDETGQVVGITAAAVDITERKQIEAELQTRVLQQAAIATLGQHALASTDLNQLMEETVQLTAQTLQVPYCKVLQLLPDRKQLLIQWGVGWPAGLLGQATVPTDPTSHAGYTLSIREAIAVNDLQHDPRFTGSPLLHQQGIVGGIAVAIAGNPHPFGILAVHTTRLRTFTQDDVNFLVAISNILAETIQRQQTREALRQQSIELQRANWLKDEFLATISHELRTPLNSMMGWAKLLPTRQFDAATTARAIDSISRNTQTLAQLVEDVLDMSDILTGQLKLQMAPVDLTLVTEQAIASLDLAAQAKKIAINLHSTLTTETVLGDASRLQQVVWNLLSNAIKFTPVGGRVGVSLSLVTGHSSLATGGHSPTVDSTKQRTKDKGQRTEPIQNSKFKIQNSTPYLCLTVTDTGKGISPEFLPFVFDRFRQEDGSTTRHQGGLGLGLAIVRYLVELHGGTIQAASPGVDQGATFTVLLPIA